MLSQETIEKIADALFSISQGEREGDRLYSGIDADRLPSGLKKRLFDEIGYSKEKYVEVVFHDAIGNVSIHDDEVYVKYMGAREAVLIPLAIVEIQKTNVAPVFIHCRKKRWRFDHLERGGVYRFDPGRNHGIMSDHRILMLVLWRGGGNY